MQAGLTGPIPASVFQLTGLTFLSLAQNSLTGPISTEIGNLVNLQRFGISNNQLPGGLPQSIYSLTNLESLVVHSNRLSRGISADIGRLADLVIRYLNNNTFTGSIAPEIGQIPILSVLHLEDNFFSGSVPPSIGNIQSRFLGNNCLSGVTDGRPSADCAVVVVTNTTTSLATSSSTSSATSVFTNPATTAPASATAPAPASSSTAISVTLQPDDPASASATSIAPIVGGVVAALVLVALAVVAVILVRRRRADTQKHDSAPPALTGFVVHQPAKPYAPPDQPPLQPVAAQAPDLVAVQAYPQRDYATQAALPPQTFTPVGPSPLRHLPQHPHPGPPPPPVPVGARPHQTRLHRPLRARPRPPAPKPPTAPCPPLSEIASWTSAQVRDALMAGWIFGLRFGDKFARFPSPTRKRPNRPRRRSNPPKMSSDCSTVSTAFPSLGIPTACCGYNDTTNGRSIAIQCDASSAVTSLQLDSVGISGTIPTSVFQLTGLTFLSMAQNSLSGSVPAQIGSLVNLRRLGLASNQLTGQLPSSIYTLTNLESLVVHSNRFSGGISADIGRLSNLVFLYLNNNTFTGSIAPEIGRIPTLSVLHLEDNYFTGTAPASLNNIQTRFLGNNCLSGATDGRPSADCAAVLSAASAASATTAGAVTTTSASGASVTSGTSGTTPLTSQGTAIGIATAASATTFTDGGVVVFGVTASNGEGMISISNSASNADAVKAIAAGITVAGVMLIAAAVLIGYLVNRPSKRAGAQPPAPTEQFFLRSANTPGAPPGGPDAVTPAEPTKPASPATALPPQDSQRTLDSPVANLPSPTPPAPAPSLPSLPFATPVLPPAPSSISEAFAQRDTESFLVSTVPPSSASTAPVLPTLPVMELTPAAAMAAARIHADEKNPAAFGKPDTPAWALRAAAPVLETDGAVRRSSIDKKRPLEAAAPLVNLGDAAPSGSSAVADPKLPIFAGAAFVSAKGNVMQLPSRASMPPPAAPASDEAYLFGGAPPAAHELPQYDDGISDVGVGGSAAPVAAARRGSMEKKGWGDGDLQVAVGGERVVTAVAPPRLASAVREGGAGVSVFPDRVAGWSVEEVGKRLEAAGVPDGVIKALKANNINGAALVGLTDADLVRLGVSDQAVRENLLRFVRLLSGKTAK
ncbi:hypothetical protein HDU96_001026 [Phlyctochytrium bullatum]|nr:hypothetical protein HDU96_001026 [Phlyctochytrium bullatum]